MPSSVELKNGLPSTGFFIEVTDSKSQIATASFTQALPVESIEFSGRGIIISFVT